MFAIDAANGPLREVEQVPPEGIMPRNFSIDPTGGYLFAANQFSGNVALFRINPETGRLTPTTTSLNIGVPVSIQFVPVQK